MVVHLLRIGTVKPLHIRGDAFAKVSFEAVNADIHQTFQLVGIPLAGLWISEVINRQARLPFIPLPQGTVRALEQIPFRFQFIEQRGFLTDVGVYPYAHLQPFLFQAADHAFRVREGHRVPLKVAPLEGLHPETVEVKDVQRQIALGHTVDKAVHRRFVVIGGERCGQPQTERPGWRQRRTAGKAGIAIQHRLRRWAVDDEIFQILAFNAELNFRHFLRADFKRHALRMVHQHAVAAVGEIKRDVLVRLLGTGTAIAVPGFHRLAVTYQRGKTLTQPVHRFSHAQIQTLKHIVTPAVGILYVTAIL